MRWRHLSGATETTLPSFPRKRESRFVRFRLFPIDSCRVGGLDSRLRGNDGTLGFCFCLRPLQNSFPSRQPKPKHRFSAVFAPNTA
ncbi:hypothetical protein E4O73_06220 [Neisseria meningitidis]|nr:hypothetical protein [Neisseria meningitidis]MBG8681067.1 hypothetical protein [Neisseria meningitidis]MBG8682315.1 hypothetical protein [Neisseria meningitidis]MBG8711251.1 hypothetical protein [Neisseria meningitidis]MBG8714729.1 hypothetical protein [Neisseria meningitidis]